MRYLALAILALPACADAPLEISISPESATLVGGQTIEVAVSVDRSSGFDDAVEIVVEGLPPGIDAPGITISAEATSGTLVLAADPRIETLTEVVTIEAHAGERNDADTLELIMRTPGGLADLSFGVDGHVTYCPVASCEATALAVLPDGKILIAARGAGSLVVSRLTDAGDPDPDFGDGGSTVVPSVDGGDSITMLVQSDGAILVGGMSWASAAAVWRFTPDGAIDETFAGGRVDLSEQAAVLDLAERPDGRILVAGHSWDVSELTGFLASLLPTGALDPNFGGAGLVWDAGGTFSSIAVLADGGFIAAGAAEDVLPSQTHYLHRYAGDGALDPAFVAAEIESWATSWDRRAHIALQPDGKIVEAYTTRDGDRWALAAARFLPDGALDTSFGAAGTAVVPMQTNATVTHVLLDAVGRIVIVGTGGVSGDPYEQRSFVLARLTTAGEPDPIFGIAGSLEEPLVEGPEDFAVAPALALQPDGKLLVGGAAFIGDFENGWSPTLELVRLMP